MTTLPLWPPPNTRRESALRLLAREWTTALAKDKAGTEWLADKTTSILAAVVSLAWVKPATAVHVFRNQLVPAENRQHRHTTGDLSSPEVVGAWDQEEGGWSTDLDDMEAMRAADWQLETDVRVALWYLTHERGKPCRGCAHSHKEPIRTAADGTLCTMHLEAVRVRRAELTVVRSA